MDGIINILKPPGMTSHDVVAYLRRVGGIKKVGHTGTLDPGAAGVLPVCIGKATKIVDYIMNGQKEYICEMTLGEKTDTYDGYGKTVEAKEFPEDLPLDEFKKVLLNFTGDIMQAPPAYSAIKISGKRAYDLARQGIDVDIPKRSVTIYSIDVLKYKLPTILLKISCSKGTYIRSICNDIGEYLGCGAYMSFLLRTKTSSFTISDSVVLEDVKSDTLEKYLTKIDDALDMRSITLSEDRKKYIANGNPTKVYNHNFQEQEKLKVYIGDNTFVGIGKIENNMLYMEKLLNDI